MVELIESFDRPRRQVLLSATVVEVDITDQFNFGFKYGREAAASSDVGGQYWGGGLTDVSFGRSTEEVESFLLTMLAMKGGETAGASKGAHYKEQLKSW